MLTRALVVAALLFASQYAAARELAIAVELGARCHDVRTADGGCLTAQTVALVGRYGEVHGTLLANYFGSAGGVVVGAAWGGDLGSPFFRLARDRLRLAVRLTLDMGVIRHDNGGRAGEVFDLDWASFVVGPQLWVRIASHAFFLVRGAVGGSFFILATQPPLGGHGALTVTPTADGAIGFAFEIP
jgi:hypothetical protein